MITSSDKQQSRQLTSVQQKRHVRLEPKPHVVKLAVNLDASLFPYFENLSAQLPQILRYLIIIHEQYKQKKNRLSYEATRTA